MNKKFSTLLAGVALFGAMSANAQTSVNTDIKLKEGQNEELYQLKVDGGFLTINENGKLDTVQTVTSANLSRTLWCVSVSSENQGQHPKFDFLNKGAQAYLDVTMDGLAGTAYAPDTKYPAADTVAVGGEIGGWAFSSVFANGIEKKNPLYSYFTKDSVVGLAFEAGVAKLIKTSADKIATTFTDSVALVKAEAIELNSDEINTVLGTQDAKAGVNLTFNPDVMGTTLKNPFKEGKFLTAPSGEGNFVYVLSKDSSYLYVDTTYTNTIGAAKFLAYKWSDLRYAKIKKSAADSITANALANQFKFLFTYYPTDDSLEIQVKNVLFEEGGVFAGTTPSDSVYVSLQELVKGQTRILTVDSVAQNTRIAFGYKGCGVSATDKTSIDNGLYVIYNEKGQVLASPIHENGNKYAWVTLDEQDPKHMPAYQWLVEKTQTSETFKATSPIVITNREFEDGANVQLRLKDGKVVSDGFTVGTLNVAGVINFVQITDSVILKDPYLGYKNFDENDLTVSKYKFNYLHPFSQDKWIKKGEAKDSVLYATDGYTAFEISMGEEVAYGATAANVEGLKGIANLVRTQYVISLKKDTVGVGAEDKIVLGQVDVDSVYFKENNHFNGDHYYAILFVANKEIGANKYGVADDGMTANLKSQVLEESRTSAFAIKVDDVPLYRRFNSVELDGAVEGNEDATKLLKFKEAYVSDYLMDETNENFQRAAMDYLGIGAKNIAEAGLSFHVRPFNIGKSKLHYIKPQYLVYVSETEKEGTPGKACTEDGPHVDKDGNITDAEHCVHATPGVDGFVRYKLLVSFADSAKSETSNVVSKEQRFKFGKYTRVGFVDAVEQDSVLYILGNRFADVKTADLDMEAVKEAVKGINLKKAVMEDIHHNYTWSFRYIDPEKAANEVEEDRAFLIESNRGDADIAPLQAAWLKNQNNCLVLSDPKESDFAEAKIGGDNALIFNIEKGAADDMATDNEVIATSEVAVIAGEGQVTVAGAAGKKVVITNILGQVVANTVVASDNAVIAAPQGVVVVAIEGEEAVKAIVK